MGEGLTSRYFLDISYNGVPYHGWQKQANTSDTIQQKIEDALVTILNLESLLVYGSGRTDTGVHAIQQIAHVDLPASINSSQLLYSLNAILPKSIALNNIQPVAPEAHARFSAESRTYLYRISLDKNPFLENRVYFYVRSPDLQAMNEAAQHLLGVDRDYQSFSKVHTSVSNFQCSVSEACWRIVKDPYGKSILEFTIEANRFLRGMVRAIVGTLLLVGEQKLSVNDFINILVSKDRKLAGRSVPPQGLYLSKIKYPDWINLR